VTLFYVSNSAVDCLERLISEMTYYVLSGTLTLTHSLSHSVRLQTGENFSNNTVNPQRKSVITQVCSSFKPVIKLYQSHMHLVYV